MWTEQKMRNWLADGRLSFPPLFFKLMEQAEKTTKAEDFDLVLQASWREKKLFLGVVLKAQWTPKAFQTSLLFMQAAALPTDWHPILIMPYLSEYKLHQLEQVGLNGVDLCGNGVINIPGFATVFRTGAKNRYPSSALIKKVYQKNSSMAARVFLDLPQYQSVKDLQLEINRRNPLVARGVAPPMSQATVSKVLNNLVDDLMVARNGAIYLLQADKLLDRLAREYTFVRPGKTVLLKVPANGKAILDVLSTWAGESGQTMMVSGLSASSRYTVMQRGEMLTVFCPELGRFNDKISGFEAERFANLELIEIADEAVYFAAAEMDGLLWASPVQCYLELMAGDKRDQETAEMIKDHILRKLAAKT